VPAPGADRVTAEKRPAPGLNGDPVRPAAAPARGFWHFWRRAPAGPKQGPVQADSTREVIETIVFVVVLVLLLKSFAAEAFVIPTGSMAETLWGYQKVVTCPKCGIDFPVNCSSEVDPTDGPRTEVTGCTCPNCRQHIYLTAPSRQLLDQRWLEDHPDYVGVKDPGWSSGDRVLVGKFVYDLLGKLPERHDVVVFKYPGDDRFPTTGPQKNHVPMNYIKRLIGLSGETIAIMGGKIYILPPDKSPKYKDTEEAAPDPQLQSLLWQAEHMHKDEAINLFNDGLFQILRKKPETILAMRRLVYDNDHPARDLVGKQPPRWAGAKGKAWAEDGANGFRHPGGDAQGGEATEIDWLRYRHILRGNRDDKPELITDFMGYNSWEAGMHTQPGANWASDLIVECDVTLDKAEGEVLLEVSKGVDRFQARWDLASGVCTLYRLTRNQEEKLDSKPTAVNKPGGTYRLRLANVDERLTVWVDGSLPFGDGVPYTAPAPARRGPREANDLERPASIGARGAAVAVRKIKLWRDTYYTTGGKGKASPGQVDVSFDPGNSATWSELREPPVSTFYVQPGHFLCLGDNSPESSDGRTWGTVPKRLMLGRALLVYYPFSRAGRIR
jgi:signal peptidase I